MNLRRRSNSTWRGGKTNSQPQYSLSWIARAGSSGIRHTSRSPEFDCAGRLKRLVAELTVGASDGLGSAVKKVVQPSQRRPMVCYLLGIYRSRGIYDIALWAGPQSSSKVLDKSQPAMAESPVCDRIAFASCLETGLRMYPPEKS
jgi:hypothetical protein